MITLYVFSVLIFLANANCDEENSKLFEEITVTPKQNPNDSQKIYKADRADLATRPLPEWYDEAKIGISLHWGLYSVPSFGTEWFWYRWKGDSKKDIVDFMKKNYPPGFSYQEFAPMFTAELFDAQKWAELFAEAGAKYVVLTCKHHDGFPLFPSKQSDNWNAVKMGPKRDLVGELAKAVRKENMTFGVHYTLTEFFNPIYEEDKKASIKTYKHRALKVVPDLKQLVKDYKPSLIWVNGDWESKDDYWNSTVLLAWLYNESPVKDNVVVINRWKKAASTKHGVFLGSDGKEYIQGLGDHKWENLVGTDTKSWAYRRNIEVKEIASADHLLHQVVSTVSKGGNVLINVGPTKEGTIIPIFQERLLDLGKWLKINGEAIYGSSRWLYQNDAHDNNVWYTYKKQTNNTTAVYATILKWPKKNLLSLKSINEYMKTFNIFNYSLKLLGNTEEYLNRDVTDEYINIQLPDRATVISERAWTLKFTFL